MKRKKCVTIKHECTIATRDEEDEKQKKSLIACGNFTISIDTHKCVWVLNARMFLLKFVSSLFYNILCVLLDFILFY